MNPAQLMTFDLFKAIKIDDDLGPVRYCLEKQRNAIGVFHLSLEDADKAFKNSLSDYHLVARFQFDR